MMRPGVAAVMMLAGASALAQTGGPPTTIVTPGAAPRSMGGDRPAVAAPTTDQPVADPKPGQAAPGGSPGTAQRPTPDQSR